jgi:hypothetical protein
MPIFTDEEMQEFADTFEELGMPDRCIISRNVFTDVEYGQDEDPVVVGESACLVEDPASAKGAALLQVYADRLGSLVSWPMSTPLGTDIQEGDILTVTCRLIPQSQVMKVQVVADPKSFAVSHDFIASQVK